MAVSSRASGQLAGVSGRTTPAADQRRCQAVGRADEAVREPSLHARLPSIDRAGPGADRHYPITPGRHLELTADSTEAAGGARRPLDRSQVEEPGFGQGSRRAGTDAPAAGHAVGLGPRPAATGRGDGGGPSGGQHEREGALHLIAHPHAARTGDAQVAVVFDVGVAEVEAAGYRRVRRAEGCRPDIELPADSDQLAAFHGEVQRALGQLGDHQFQDVPGGGHRDRIVGAYPHACRRRGHAGRERTAPALHGDQADPAGAVGGELGAQGRHGRAGGPAGRQQRRAGCHRHLGAVDGQSHAHRDAPASSSST